MKKIRTLSTVVFMFGFTQTQAAINYGKYLISPDIIFDGKTAQGDGYNVDNNKKEAIKTSAQSSSFIHWGQSKPEQEEVTYVTEAKLERGKNGFKSGKIQTATWYKDGKLRSATKCRNIGAKSSDNSDLEMNCVTASSQACSGLLAAYETQLKAESLENLKKEVNQCSDLLNKYANLAYHFAQTQNDDARVKVIETDMKLVEKATEGATGTFRWNLLSKNVFSVNKTSPKELMDEMARSSKLSAVYIQSIQDALDLCQDNKDNFRRSGYIPTVPRVKKNGGVDNG